ncbi:ABC transporter ATP-binding protein [Agriterribacter sp.]|uniref:ABC transporter ATP-binding protein n=1 Tax=Agriterribacter sp. TaxID=2821509 RepID=UPI002B748C96|nr:ABC transporter ATP-binding protein [Agriterribacter sp.]HRO44246.1 ABC transporter ATP-binding protein [Agriterribacter sp.]HRQ19610.1 ABC transporter ATP-binding protein [Agriterribacter sp.]
MKAVTLKNITKTYDKGKVLAVDDVTLQIDRGELFGLIGPDGAGKTSVFRILTTVLLADKGSASVDGFDVVKDYQSIRRRIGYMPGKFSLYQDLTVKENLGFFATLFGTTIEENYALIKDIYEQIEPFKNRRAGKLSGGMKQKLALCCALIHKPEVLFLDEPTTGVDAVSRREFWEMLKRLKQQGITILVSTPYMDEAVLCERIALMQNGKIMSVNTPQHIIATYPVPLYAVKSGNIYKLLNDLRKSELVESSFAFGEYLHVTLKNNDAAGAGNLRNHIAAQGHTNIEVSVMAPTIEDSFIRLTNKKQGSFAQA